MMEAHTPIEQMSLEAVRAEKHTLQKTLCDLHARMNDLRKQEMVLCAPFSVGDTVDTLYRKTHKYFATYKITRVDVDVENDLVTFYGKKLKKDHQTWGGLDMVLPTVLSRDFTIVPSTHVPTGA